MDNDCAACGVKFSNRDALESHARNKVAEESKHYRDMLAHGQADPIFPGTQEKPT